MRAIFSDRDKTFDLRSWGIISAIALGFLCWGIFVFMAVGEKGTPSWDFSVVEDIPSQSVYSTHQAEQVFGDQPPLAPQHIPGVTPPPPPSAGGVK